MKFVIEQTETGWTIEQSDGEENVWPLTATETARDTLRRLMQLMDSLAEAAKHAVEAISLHLESLADAPDDGDGEEHGPR